MIRFAVGFLAGLALATGAHAACPDGAYAVVGSPLLSSPGGAFTTEVVTIANRTVAIASGCPAIAARIRQSTRGTLVRAVWRSCGAVQRVRLRAVVNKPCRTMRGLVTTRRPTTVRRFTAINDETACGSHTPAGCTCETNADCATPAPIRVGALYCAKTDGTCGEPGRCQPRPTTCDGGGTAVCGCDGTTYASPCEAARHGVAIAHTGACEGQPEVCGGIAGVPCATGEFCELPASTCTSADLQGTCMAIPAICPEISMPVCGCDGVTYSNDCDRQAVGAQLAHDGPCGDTCTSACDCEKARPLPSWCGLLACPACECRWLCEQNTCAVHIGTIIDPPVCAP